MSLDLFDEVPHLCASLRVLEAESIVDAVRFCPDDQGLCSSEEGSDETRVGRADRLITHVDTRLWLVWWAKE